MSAADVLRADSAVAGEAAAIAMGLLCCGAKEESADSRAREMVEHTHRTQHEKIIRGLAIGLAMASYGREENADGLIEQLTTDQARNFLPSSTVVACFIMLQAAQAIALLEGYTSRIQSQLFMSSLDACSVLQFDR